MTEATKSDDKFLRELEASVTAILKNRKASKADKLGAIREGVKLAAIKHRINGNSDDDQGFFK